MNRVFRLLSGLFVLGAVFAQASSADDMPHSEMGQALLDGDVAAVRALVQTGKLAEVKLTAEEEAEYECPLLMAEKVACERQQLSSLPEIFDILLYESENYSQFGTVATEVRRRFANHQKFFFHIRGYALSHPYWVTDHEISWAKYTDLFCDQCDNEQECKALLDGANGTAYKCKPNYYYNSGYYRDKPECRSVQEYCCGDVYTISFKKNEYYYQSYYNIITAQKKSSYVGSSIKQYYESPSSSLEEKAYAKNAKDVLHNKASLSRNMRARTRFLQESLLVRYASVKNWFSAKGFFNNNDYDEYYDDKASRFVELFVGSMIVCSLGAAL